MGRGKGGLAILIHICYNLLFVNAAGKMIAVLACKSLVLLKPVPRFFSKSPNIIKCFPLLHCLKFLKNLNSWGKTLQMIKTVFS